MTTVSASGDAERLTTSPYIQVLGSWFPDGRTLIYHETHPETGRDLWLLPLDGDRVPEPFLRTPFNERNAHVSPDGRFVAYESNESGRWEVYIRAFADSGSKTQVSTAGGIEPRWRPDGTEIFYRWQSRFMAVDVSLCDGALVLGRPVTLFEDDSIISGSQGKSAYDVSSDGFIAIDTTESEPPPTELELVLNWGEELKRLATPTN
jgi:dipeptidyl aminopeptidase/acylaminoacyl peptidase